MSATSAILLGGPSDGKIIAVTGQANTVETAFAMPLLPITAEPARPRWWRHPFRYLRWKPPAARPLVPLELIQLRYAADGTTDGGHRVFRLASPWQPYRGPAASPQDDGSLYKALVTARYAVHPVIRQDPGTRWVMNLDWWKRCRREAVAQGYGGDDDEETWKPSPEDTLMGTGIRVTGDGGAPHLENPKYPQDWPGDER